MVDAEDAAALAFLEKEGKEFDKVSDTLHKAITFSTIG